LNHSPSYLEDNMGHKSNARRKKPTEIITRGWQKLCLKSLQLFRHNLDWKGNLALSSHPFSVSICLSGAVFFWYLAADFLMALSVLSIFYKWFKSWIGDLPVNWTSYLLEYFVFIFFSWKIQDPVLSLVLWWFTTQYLLQWSLIFYLDIQDYCWAYYAIQSVKNKKSPADSECVGLCNLWF